MSLIEKNYQIAKEMYAAHGVSSDAAMEALSKIPLSVHCWQGDDVRGFENGMGATGGIQATGDFPGRARSPEELRADLDMALSLLPGKSYRVNLHAIYAETDGSVSRDGLMPEHFAGWAAWAKERSLGLDFNGTFFSHEMASSGFTLSHRDNEVRDFWIRHACACRRIGTFFGRELGTPCITNLWIPDGCKDNPADRYSPRLRLKDSLDRVYAEKIDGVYNKDAVESKLFGIGSEAYVTGSHEFYLGYASANGIIPCLDTGHFHPAESVADKISAMLCFHDELLLHLSRPMRWDSDHVVALDDAALSVARELTANAFLPRVHIATDYFDASINRVAAWVIGARNVRKALLIGLLEPTATLRSLEAEGDLTSRLALTEELKSMPWAAVWDYYCEINNVPAGPSWLAGVQAYWRDTQSKR